ncbi:unnamed protein product [Durusdinium trenchii]|uniref:25S rRNA (uridine-N(3))-methyltransferase BMT5-like domain-containing protein n=1 Tax=Durusdinium trenchii TaxID=1381693 RepID=A0ABP0MI18_9DINO
MKIAAVLTTCWFKLFCFVTLEVHLGNSIMFQGLLRTLSHKDLRYIIDHYDGTQQLEELVQEAQQALPLEGRTEGCMPDAPGVAAISRFHRLELIDPTADAAVFGDANLSFSLNLVRHRKALGHVGRVIATTFESREVLRERYKEIDETIKTLQDRTLPKSTIR